MLVDVFCQIKRIHTANLNKLKIMCKLSNVGSIPALPTHTDVAQLIERSLHAGNVVGLSPAIGTNKHGNVASKVRVLNG